MKIIMNKFIILFVIIFPTKIFALDYSMYLSGDNNTYGQNSVSTNITVPIRVFGQANQEELVRIAAACSFREYNYQITPLHLDEGVFLETDFDKLQPVPLSTSTTVYIPMKVYTTGNKGFFNLSKEVYCQARYIRLNSNTPLGYPINSATQYLNLRISTPAVGSISFDSSRLDLGFCSFGSSPLSGSLGVNFQTHAYNYDSEGNGNGFRGRIGATADLPAGSSIYLVLIGMSGKVDILNNSAPIDYYIAPSRGIITLTIPCPGTSGEHSWPITLEYTLL